jgi:MinD superfamily P-loop ATPase
MECIRSCKSKRICRNNAIMTQNNRNPLTTLNTCKEFGIYCSTQAPTLPTNLLQQGPSRLVNTHHGQHLNNVGTTGL